MGNLESSALNRHGTVDTKSAHRKSNREEFLSESIGLVITSMVEHSKSIFSVAENGHGSTVRAGGCETAFLQFIHCEKACRSSEE